MKKYKISFFQNSHSNTAIERELTFKEIIDYFNETVKKKFNGKDKLEAIVCGAFLNQKRSTENLICRTIITYDIDYYKHNLNILINYIKERLKNYTYIYYTTVSSTFDRPKLRILLFINQDVNVNEYKVVTYSIAKFLLYELFNESNYIKANEGIESAIDKASYVPAQLMYVPCRTGTNFECSRNNAELVDVKKYLNPEIVENNDDEIKDFLVTGRNSPLSISDEKVKNTLADYNVEDTDRVAWLRVGQGLHHQYRGSDEGYNLFLEWSLKDNRYSEKEIRRETKIAYQSLKQNKLNPITFASIIYIINSKKKDCPEMKNEAKKIYHKISFELFPDIELNKKGEISKILLTFENFERMCEIYNIQIRYDTITKRNITSLDSEDDNDIATRLKSLLELNKMSRNVANDYIKEISRKNTFNSFKEILDSIFWDGKNRIKDFLNTVTVDEEYIEARDTYVTKWLQQMLYLATCEGNKKIARQLLVFQGEQGIGKSTWVRSLMPEHLSHYIGEGLTLNTNDDMSILKCIRHIFVELAELEHSFKKTDINAFKSFFGKTEDTLNIKYLAHPVTYQRTTSFLGTVNDKTFLKDKTGNTRFLILPVKKLNGYHNIDMLQLYRELLETTNIINFELSDEDKVKQKLINQQFDQPDLIEEQFTNMFETEFEEQFEIEGKVEYKNCTDILDQLGYSIRDITYTRRVDLANVLDKYKFKYRKDLKKWLVKLKNGEIK